MKKLIDLLSKTLYVLTPTQKKICVLVFFMTSIGSVLECLGVSVIIPLVNVIANPESVLKSKYIRDIEWIQNLEYNQLVILIVAGIVVLYIVKNLYFIFLAWVRIKFATKIQRETSIKMMTSLMSRGYKYFLDNNYGEYSRSVGGDAATMNLVLNADFKVLSEAMTIALICIFMLVSDFQLAIAVIFLALICLLLIYFIFRKMIYNAGQIAREYGAKMGQTLSESYFGIKDIMLFRKQKYFISEYESNSIQTQKAQCRQTVGVESPTYIIEAICVSGLMLCIGFRVVFGGTDSNFIAVLAAFAIGAFRVLPSLGKISSSLNTLTASIPQINGLYEEIIIAEQYAANHPETAEFIKAATPRKGLISRGNTFSISNKKQHDTSEKFHSNLELRNVTFAYNDEIGDVLNNINLTIKKGQAIGVIGSSGAGKSTLIDVLLGLLIPQSGHIYMDGQDIEEIPEKWSETIAYVPQSVFLCDDSIKRNVAFGETVDDIDIDDVKEALDKAKLMEFVNELPDGIEHITGDRGVRISGGQRQRIAIARALYHHPEILVLDEATSALDNDTESAIMDAINMLYGEVTLIIVAHRLSTVKNCDVIYEVKDGCIIERNKEEIIDKL